MEQPESSGAFAPTRRSLLKGGATALGAAAVATLSPTNAEAFASAVRTNTGTTSGRVSVAWQKVVKVSATTPTLQVVVCPPLRRGSTAHSRAWKELKRLDADGARFVPWYNYPRLTIPALAPPTDSTTSWDFSLVDPFVEDFMNATRGRSNLINFSTIPHWMWKTDTYPVVPEDPNQQNIDYNVGTELAVSLEEVGEYFARIVSWYTAGGFHDELGRYHHSGHRYEFNRWGILVEPEYEHKISPQLYVQIYDAVAAAIRKVAPDIEFVGPGTYDQDANYLQHVLDPANHSGGEKLDWLAYHFYGYVSGAPTEWPTNVFAQADGFLNHVNTVETARKQLSPTTKTTIEEVGTFFAGAIREEDPVEAPPEYWTFSAAMYAYVFANLSKLGINYAGHSQLMGSPGNFPTTSLLDWESGKPTARYRVLDLMIENFGPGDRIVESTTSAEGLFTQAVKTLDGERKVLLVNKSFGALDLDLPSESKGGRVDIMDVETQGGPWRSEKLRHDGLQLPAFGIAVLTYPAKNRA